MSNFTINFPIEMIKKEQRIVSGIATADNVDKAGDLINFEASLEAFKNWQGNIREMHAPIAVGRAINYEPVQIKGDDGKMYNAIRVDAYISKGAEDTWQKVLDGTLRAFSVGGKILEKEQLSNKSYYGRPVNHIKKYVLGELSLVDNPGNAAAVIDIVKRSDCGELDYILKIDCGDIDLSIPEAVQNAARVGLEQRRKEGRGGTSVGYGSARRLSAGGVASEQFVRKVAKYFPRHEVDKQGKGWNPGEDGYPSNGRIAWNLWGGDAGWAWSRSKVEQLNNCTTRKSVENGCSCGCGSCEELEKEVSVTTQNATSKYPTQGSFKTPKNPNMKKPRSYMFKTKEEAMKKASELGCEGVQEIVVNGDIMYRACGNTQDYIAAISKDIISSIDESLLMQKDGNESLVDEVLENTEMLGSEATQEEELNKMEDVENSSEEIVNVITESLTESISKFENSSQDSESANFVKMQDDLLQNHEIYDSLSRIDEISESKLSLLKRFVNWLIPENETNASTISVEVENDQVEEEMDVNILKEALGNVIDEKLTEFSTSIKAEIDASVNEKLETITKGFEVQTTELQEKLQTAEQALAEQTEKVEAFASAGAIKKSVDPEDDGEEVELKKSAPKSVWNNIYLPQDLIESMGYES